MNACKRSSSCRRRASKSWKHATCATWLEICRVERAGGMYLCMSAGAWLCESVEDLGGGVFSGCATDGPRAGGTALSSFFLRRSRLGGRTCLTSTSIVRRERKGRSSQPAKGPPVRVETACAGAGFFGASKAIARCNGDLVTSSQPGKGPPRPHGRGETACTGGRNG